MVRKGNVWSHVAVRVAAVATAFVIWIPAASRHAAAVELGGGDATVPVQVHGFVSQGWIRSWRNNYLAESRRFQGSFEFTEVGINFTTQPTERLRIGLQLFARDLGPTGTYSAKMDWLMLDYRWRDWFGIRAGRVKLPFGLYNDISDVDAARVPVLLPTSIYSPTNRDFFLAQSGLEFYGYVPLAGAGALDYRVFAGTIYLDRPTMPGARTQVTSVENPYLAGGRLFWETPVDGLRVGLSGQALRLEFNGVNTSVVDAAGQGVRGTYALRGVLWLASIEYAAREWLLAAEYGRFRITTSTTDAAVFPLPGTTLAERTATSELGYVMVARRLTRWFQPGAYYSVSFSDVDHRTDSRAGMALDAALTLRFDLNAHWLVKLEGHHVHGTAGLATALNDNVPLANLPKDWFVFLLKTTAHF